MVALFSVAFVSLSFPPVLFAVRSVLNVVR